MPYLVFFTKCPESKKLRNIGNTLHDLQIEDLTFIDALDGYMTILLRQDHSSESQNLRIKQLFQEYLKQMIILSSLLFYLIYMFWDQ